MAEPNNSQSSMFSSQNSTKSLTTDLEERLIEAVREHPTIYNKSCKLYRNRNARANAFKRIGKAINRKGTHFYCYKNQIHHTYQGRRLGVR